MSYDLMIGVVCAIVFGVVMFYVGHFAGGTDMLAECWGIER